MRDRVRMPRLPRPLNTRRAYIREKQALGIRLSAVQRVICVEPEIIFIPSWARTNAVLLLPEHAERVWLWPQDARYLTKLDEAEGGHPTITEAEYCECPICHRPLLGIDAEGRRFLNESCGSGRQIPCGPECTIASQDKRWVRMKRHKWKERHGRV